MNKGGCWAILILLFLIGLIGLGLQKIGCLSSDEALRAGTVVAVTGKEVVESKNIFVVKYTVTNETKWPARVEIEWVVRKTTGTVVARNPVRFDRLPPGETEEQLVMFALDELKQAGIGNPLDEDLCPVDFTLVSAKDADSAVSR